MMLSLEDPHEEKDKKAAEAAVVTEESKKEVARCKDTRREQRRAKEEEDQPRLDQEAEYKNLEEEIKTERRAGERKRQDSVDGGWPNLLSNAGTSPTIPGLERSPSPHRLTLTLFPSDRGPPAWATGVSSSSAAAAPASPSTPSSEWWTGPTPGPGAGIPLPATTIPSKPRDGSVRSGGGGGGGGGGGISSASARTSSNNNVGGFFGPQSKSERTRKHAKHVHQQQERRQEQENVKAQRIAKEAGIAVRGLGKDKRGRPFEENESLVNLIGPSEPGVSSRGRINNSTVTTSGNAGMDSHYRVRMPTKSEGISIMPNAKNFDIDTLNVNATQNVYNNTSGDADLNSRLDPIPDASHTRNRKASPPDSRCLPGTRSKVLDAINKWAGKSLRSNPTRVYWLYGYVGCGKSSIAQAVAERFHRKGRLVASFFFFRSSERRSRFKSFPATLACQMAAAIPATAPLILNALKSQVGLSSMSVGKQMELLVYKPLKTFMRSGMNGFGATSLLNPFLITIDGLDECKDQDEVAEFIDYALSYFRKHPRFPLRFFITSRVEEHIRTRLNTDEVCLDNLIDHSPDEDIIQYIHATFEDARTHSRVIQTHGDWPGMEDVQGLVKLGGGSFIFISMLLRYILISVNGDERTPKERLPLALDMNSGLDHLYTETLGRSKDLPHFSSIISTLACSQKPFSTSEIAEFLDIELHQVTAVLVNLHSIIHLPGDDITPVTLCHTSLQDFLITETRSGSFYVPPIHHKIMARQCIRLIIPYYRITTPQQPIVEYATRYVYRHFELSSSRHDYLDTRQQLYTMATTYLIWRYPDSSSLVMSTWMMMERMDDGKYPFGAGVVAGFLGPAVPDAELITKILYAVINLDPSTGGEESKFEFWKDCLAQSHPALLDSSHHTFLAKQCVRCFITEPPPISNSWRRLVLEYACTRWAFHLEMSVEHDVAMDLRLLRDIGISSNPFQHTGYEPTDPPDPLGHPSRLFYAIGFTTKGSTATDSIVTAIERRFPGTKLRNPDRWVIAPSLIPKDFPCFEDGVCVQGKYPVSFIDLLDALGQISKDDVAHVEFVDRRGSIVFVLARVSNIIATLCVLMQ